MDIKGSLATYKIVKTEDGSVTAHSGLFDENCYSTSGAWDETLYNYISGCNVIEKIRKQSKLTILEVGFGVGLGVYVTLKEIIKDNPDNLKKLLFISTEIDRDFAYWALTESDFAKEFCIAPNDIQVINGHFHVTIQGAKLIVLVGDARETIRDLKEYPLLDCIYQDAFSPQKNPTLWAIEWFRDLRSFSSNKVIMSTYSSAMRVKKAMVNGGFFVSNRQGFGRKRTCTQAFAVAPKDTESLKLHQQVINSQSIPISDETHTKTK